MVDKWFAKILEMTELLKLLLISDDILRKLSCLKLLSVGFSTETVVSEGVEGAESKATLEGGVEE